MLSESQLIYHLHHSRGWKIRRTVAKSTWPHKLWHSAVCFDYVASNAKQGISLRWIASNSRCTICEEPSEHIHVEIKLRTENGGYGRHAYNFVPRDKDIKVFDELRGAKIQPRKKDLPKPFKFNSDGLHQTSRSCDGIDLTLWQRTDVICKCMLYGIVGVTEQCALTTDIAKPGKDTWFHFLCLTHSGKKFFIITDGEVFHPVSNKGKIYRHSSDGWLNYEAFTSNDQKFLMTAIEKYLEKWRDT